MKKDFSPRDKEWHQVIINFLSILLDMKVKPMIIYDRKQFNLHTRKGIHKPNQVWAQCVIEHGLIWLSKDLVTESYVLTLNVLVHECLHIKYPEWNEKQVRNEADRVVPVVDDKERKKQFE